MENKDYIFKNSFVFVESGNLKVDIYRAFKDEVGYMCESKYEFYMSQLAMADSKKQELYYNQILDVLGILKSVLLDTIFSSIKEYFDTYDFQVKINMLTNEDIKKRVSANLILKSYDKMFDDFAYSIIEEVHKRNLQLRYGVFVLLKNYFRLDTKKPYNKFEEFLDKAYSMILETIKVKNKE